MCFNWAELYASVATSREYFLKYKTLLDKEALKLIQGVKHNVNRLQGELEVD